MTRAAGPWREGARTVGFMTALTALFISAVTGAHLLTRDAVARNRTRHIQRAVRAAAGLPADPAAGENATVETGPGRYEVETPAGRIVVRLAQGAGLWGPIQAAVGIRLADQTLAGFAVIAQSETPGLGARIEEPGFAAQFAGKRPPLTLAPEGARSPRPDTVDAVTGASITSRAVRDLVNAAAAAESAGAGKEAP